MAAVPRSVVAHGVKQHPADATSSEAVQDSDLHLCRLVRIDARFGRADRHVADFGNKK